MFRTTTHLATRFVAASAVLAVTAASRVAAAHCDTTKGPVVTAARAALDRGNPALVLHWVSAQDEPTIRTAFEETMAVRSLGAQPRELADRYFFETLVRIHRAGEGAPFTGLGDSEPEPIIALTDQALDQGSAAALEERLVEAVKTGLAVRFEAARKAKQFQPGDVTAGRAFVATYVPLAHWVEGVFTAASGPVEAHGASGHGEHNVHGAATAGDAENGSAVHDADHSQHVPWILAGVFATTTVALGLLLARRQRPVAA